MARSTKEEALETRARILDAAEQVFHERGVSQTSLADVAKAAEVTRGAIYWHFKNKSDLFDAMCERVRLPMEAVLEENASPQVEDPLGQFLRSGIYVLTMAATDERCRRVFDIIFVMTRGGPADATKTLSFFVYQESFAFLRAGSGASYAVIVAIMSAMLIAAYIFLLKRQETLA